MVRQNSDLPYLKIQTLAGKHAEANLSQPTTYVASPFN